MLDASSSLWLAVRLSLAHSSSLWLTLAPSGSLWLPLALCLALSGFIWLSQALSGSLRLSLALRICLQSPCLTHKALARLVAALPRYSTFYSPDPEVHQRVTKLQMKLPTRSLLQTQKLLSAFPFKSKHFCGKHFEPRNKMFMRGKIT